MTHVIIMFSFYYFTTKKITTTSSSPSSYGLLLRRGCKPTLLSSSYGLVLFCRHKKKNDKQSHYLSSLWGGFAKTKKWWHVTQLFLVILVWPCRRKKNNDEQLCCSSSLWCGFAKVKKWWQIVALFIFILVWFCKCEKSIMNNYIVWHCCNIVLQAQGGWRTMILVVM
jgi:hypothetical protein